MNTSIYGDKIIVLWQVLLVGGVFAFSVVFFPWLMGRKWRKKGEQPPSLARRVAACTAIAIPSLLGHATAFGLLITASNEGEMAIITLPSAVIVIGCVFVAVRIVVGWNKSVLVPVLLMVFLCCVCGVWCLVHIGKRMQYPTMQIYELAGLHGIGSTLAEYHEKHGVYPEDLRQLVDDGACSPRLLLDFCGTHSSEIPDTWPASYQGPCNFIYIRLPEDAPGDLVWVWLPLEYYDGEGGGVLFKDGDTRWLKAEQLTAEVARTHKWLEAHPTTQPASGD